jgi:DNA polymerase elongation subunit (family B)
MQTRMGDMLVFNHLKTKNMVIPGKKKTDKFEKYEGAFVKEPKTGRYEWVISFDATSLYPSIIRTMNLSPDMIIDPNGFEKPSIWTKFSKDSPLDDLSKGIKGLAGAILLRSLSRGTTRVNNAIVLTPGGVKKYKEGKPLTPRDISSNQRDQLPSEYTLNTGGGGVGVRKAYKLLGKVDGKDAYEFIEPKVGRSLGPEFASIIDLNSIFKIIFKKNPSGDDIDNFRSFQGLLRMMKKNLDKSTIKVVMERFTEILARESISQEEVTAIENAISSNLK